MRGEGHEGGALSPEPRLAHLPCCRPLTPLVLASLCQSYLTKPTCLPSDPPPTPPSLSRSSERRGGSRLSDLLEDAPLSGAELGAMLPAVGEEEELEEEEEEEGSEAGGSEKRRRSVSWWLPRAQPVRVSQCRCTADRGMLPWLLLVACI